MNERTSRYRSNDGTQKRELDCKFGAYKKRSYLDPILRAKRKIPDCTKYSKLEKWSVNPKFATTKEAKLRWLFHILHEQKSKPGPNVYNKRPKERVLGACISKDTKTYIDEMMYRAHATPPPYENIDSLILKSSGFKGVSFSNIKSDRFKRIVKTPDPGPGTYNYEPILERLRCVSRGYRLAK